MTDAVDRSQPTPASEALAQLRTAMGGCLDTLTAAPGVDLVHDLLDTAAAAAQLTVTLLERASPDADAHESGTGEALERAAELAIDTRTHLVTAMHLMAGARAITETARKHQ